MKIELKKNNSPAIQKIKFSCDEPLSNKLNQYELAKEHLNCYNTTLFVGTQGSGKTSLLINFVNKLYKKVFDKIYVFMPESSRKSLNPNIFEKLPEDQCFEELNEESINKIYEDVKILSKDDKKTLIIYDDVQKALKNKNVLLALKNIIANQRHLHVVNIILCQNYFALHRSLREIVNNVILFKLGKIQTEKVFNECVEGQRDKFEEIRKVVYNEKHNWLFINIGTQKLYRMFDELIVEDLDNDDNNLENNKI